ncbi:hypothetical protein AAGS40_27270 (plasmid) [Paraburkholderia sp. PREW-6R]|uniref:hypothetical protein n=1 Tax=Paraburkholderia sp. PREW-6R TaxID=3141544 RepID=UPI0031F52509
MANRMARWWIPSWKTLAFLCASALGSSMLLLLNGFGKQHYPLRILYRLNDAAVSESLEVSVAVTVLFVALSPALIACVLSLGIRTRALQKVCAKIMIQPLRLSVLRAQWSRDKRITSPAGVLSFIFLLDLTCIKVGASITSTIVGVCFYLLFQGQAAYLLTLFSVAIMWGICVFPAFIRFLFQRSIEHGFDTRLRRARRLFVRDLRVRRAQNLH